MKERGVRGIIGKGQIEAFYPEDIVKVERDVQSQNATQQLLYLTLQNIKKTGLLDNYLNKLYYRTDSIIRVKNKVLDLVEEVLSNENSRILIHTKTNTLMGAFIYLASLITGVPQDRLIMRRISKIVEVSEKALNDSKERILSLLSNKKQFYTSSGTPKVSARWYYTENKR